MWCKTISDNNLKKGLSPVRNNLARSLRQYRKLVRSGQRYTYECGIQYGICLGEQAQVMMAERIARDVRVKTMCEMYEAKEKGEFM
jgi:hypothetical protein